MSEFAEWVRVEMDRAERYRRGMDVARHALAVILGTAEVASTLSPERLAVQVEAIRVLAQCALDESDRAAYPGRDAAEAGEVKP